MTISRPHGPHLKPVLDLPKQEELNHSEFQGPPGSSTQLGLLEAKKPGLHDGRDVAHLLWPARVGAWNGHAAVACWCGMRKPNLGRFEWWEWWFEVGLERLGAKGKGLSVWVALFLCLVVCVRLVLLVITASMQL